MKAVNGRTDNPDLAVPDALLEVAAAWHDRLLESDASLQLRTEFSRWIDAAPEHRAAYDRVERVSRLAASAAHEPGMLALRHGTALRLTHRTARIRFASGWAAVVLAFVCGALAILQWSEPGSVALRFASAWRSLGTWTSHDSHYTTAIGERLSFTLTDGSRVELNTDSELEMAFVTAERRVVLKRGQAVFEVAKDRARPFVVEASGRRFVAVGTAFDVRVDDSEVQVTMLEGVVSVEQVPNSALPKQPAAGRTERSAAIATLTAGEQLTANTKRQDGVRIAALKDVERVTSWRRGQVIFEDARLEDAIAELNRYSTTQIELADAELANLRISGAFATGRPAVFVEALTAYFPIEATRVGETQFALRTRSPPAPLD
jgi:transmembrane sensor